jgi:CTP:molybdopterin cytidylyltransferase MocA
MEPWVGIVLAAGAGTRAGGPKALRATGAGEGWMAVQHRLLVVSGASRVLVVLGAAAEAALPLLPRGAEPVLAPDWADGLSASLAAGLAAASSSPDAVAALVTLVDLPDLPAAAVRRVLAAGPLAPEALRRATYRGAPGHPVLLGREHWAPLAAGLRGDTGAGPYLRAHDTAAVECGDLGDGRDRDRVT